MESAEDCSCIPVLRREIGPWRLSVKRKSPTGPELSIHYSRVARSWSSRIRALGFGSAYRALIRRLEELRSSFLSEQKARREKLHDQKKKIHQRFQESEMPNLEAVRPEIKSLFTTKEQLKMAPYMTATDMREVLTEEQQGRLSELSRRARHHAVMANMTMQEHMHVKQTLRGNQHGGKLDFSPG